MFVYAIDDCMLLKGVFCALCHPCNLQGILIFDHCNVALWCHGHNPALVSPNGWGHFPVMDAGGSPFPHNNGARMDAGAEDMMGTAVSSVKRPAESENGNG